MQSRAKLLLLSVLAASFVLIPMTYARVKTSYFQSVARKYNLNPTTLEGICHFESGFGRKKVLYNKNGTWDVGYCQNNSQKRSKRRPPIPSDSMSVVLAAKELVYWKKWHNHFCVNTLKKRGTCGYMKWGKWRGIHNCRRPHPWWGHYNWGFRVARNNYDKKIQCFINKGFRWCKTREWRKIRF